MCQSLNSISAFRNGISMVSKQDSKLITATQRMLAYLLFSQRQDYSPSPFLQSFREPINPNIQQDTTQFLNLYFDQLESELQTTPYRSLLRQLFQGSTVIQMICNNCKSKRERKQEYFCYSVGVREKPTLQIALEGMHQGDIINDYNCEQCKVRSDLIKRSVLGDLPNFLFLHLQRIVNLDFYRYTKIHSKCLFPLQLNIQPFTKEGVELRETVGVEYLKKLQQNQQENNKFRQLCKHDKPDKSYIYNLKAIIVHSGSADGGHYYTIMKREGGWVKLDDSKVTIFSLEQFELECYGGHFNVIGEWGIQQSKNAYVLLYEKELKSSIHLDFTEHPQQVQKLQMDLETATQGIDYQKFKTFNTQALYKQVWMDNHRLMLESHIFGEGHSKDFIRLIQSLVERSKSPRKAQLIAEVLLKISCWSNEIGRLLYQFSKCNPGYDIFLKYAKDTDNMFNLIFHNEKPIRVAMSKFLSTLVLNSVKQGPSEEVYKLLDSFLSKLNTDVAKNWLRVQSYFDFFETVVSNSVSCPELYNYFINKHLISLFIDFILQKESPLKISIKKHSMGNKFNRVQFEAGVRVISWLLARSYYFNGRDQDYNDGEHFHLSDNDIFALSSMAFYSRMIKEGQVIPVMATMIEKFAVQNYGFVEAISRTLLRMLNDSIERLNESVNIIICIQKLMRIPDSLWKKKAEFVLGNGLPYQVSKDNTFPSLDIDRFTFNSTLEDIFPIQCVMNLAYINRQRYPEVSLYMINAMLKIALFTPQATQYFKIQPSPTYLHNNYTDWWDQFIVFAFETITIKTIKQEELNKLKKQTYELLSVFKERSHPLPPLRIITGKIVKEKKIKTIKHEEIRITFGLQDQEVYATPSLPSADGQLNAAFSKYLTHNRLEDANDAISADSNILLFMSTSKPALAIADNDKVETASNKAQTSEIRQKISKHSNQVYFDASKQENKEQFNLWDENSSSQYQSQQMEQEKSYISKPEVSQLSAKDSKSMEIQYQKIDIESQITTCTYFRLITLVNDGDQTVWVRLTIEDVDYLKVNCLLSHFISGSILPHKSQTITLFKLDPSKPFGDFSYSLSVEDYSKRKKKIHPPNFFKIYENQNNMPQTQMQEQLAYEPQNIPTPVNQIPSDQKQCITCTFWNEAFAEKCEMCESVFM